MVKTNQTKNSITMNHYLRHFALSAVAVCTVAYSAFGQETGMHEVDHAVRVLKNIDADRSKEWAVATLEASLSNDSSAYVMNCLGLAYMAGLGVEADSAKAVAWLESAGRGGFANAYHNLGMMYKYGKCGVRQDFPRSYNYFAAGADSGSVVCMYDKGFMLYKGLGCGQDYEAAAGNFFAASEKQHSPSLYMLGLCYRNGYGVAQDTAKASFCLNRAAALGYRDAIDELARPYAETYLDGLYSDGDIRSGIPADMPDVYSEVNDVNLIAGSYQGYIVMYDWSGEYVLGEKPLSMNVSREGSDVFGAMVLGEDTVPFRAELTADSRLAFKKGTVTLPERYAPEGKVKYRLDNMVFDVWSDKISGSLGLYSLKLKEPERPMYFELLRSSANSTDVDGCNNRVEISPNPFEYSFVASFCLQDEADVQVRVFNINGMMVWQKPLGRLNRGENYVTLSPDIKAGKYVLNIKAGEQVFHGIIIKEGGM